jgi:hypothetical protein
MQQPHYIDPTINLDTDLNLDPRVISMNLE